MSLCQSVEGSTLTFVVLRQMSGPKPSFCWRISRPYPLRLPLSSTLLPALRNTDQV